MLVHSLLLPLLFKEIRYGPMMGAPPPGSMPPNGPSSGYGPPQRTGYSNGYGRDRPSAPPPRFNDRGYQNQEKHGED